MSTRQEKKMRRLYREEVKIKAAVDIAALLKKYKKLRKKETAKTIALCMLSVAVVFLAIMNFIQF